MGYIFVTHVHNALTARRSFAALRMTSRATEIATSGIALIAMTTPCVVILNEVKNLLKADKRPRTRCVASEGILRYAQDDSESGTLSNTEEEQSGNGAKKIGLPFREQPYHKSDISITSSVLVQPRDD